jgi:superfamily II DNA or RNA helicase
MIAVETAAKLLDFDKSLRDEVRAQEQLRGAVAIHNILKREGVAYLADEVGMGKTYVALGALALFRHFDPNFRALIIAPRQNIQEKWGKELRNFVQHNVRFPDLRVKGIDARPARRIVSPGSLVELLREVTADRDRDFILRMSSFSLPLAGKDSVDPEAAKRLRAELLRHLPWISPAWLDARNKDGFKRNVASALCCALPSFDLVIVDEAHNLKHGFGDAAASRNKVLGVTFGHPSELNQAAEWPGFAHRAKRVLFLSATPVEDSYAQLWNQLDLFGHGAGREVLRDGSQEDEKRAAAAKFLVRRVTSIRVLDEDHTKNVYRREWRRGGVAVHDEPIRVDDARQRLVVALVQKKVSELLANERFGTAFQVGMLASFESFLETAKVKQDEPSVFDGADQTEDMAAREGIDVHDVNRLARSYRKAFGAELPHPKMDALVRSLSGTWETGEKALVFVRRVASVKELKARLDDTYDDWITSRLRTELPEAVRPKFELALGRYASEKAEAAERRKEHAQAQRRGEDVDRGGLDTFFAWFFRGKGPLGVLSGAQLQERLSGSRHGWSIVFEDNLAAEVLDCLPEQVEARMCALLDCDVAWLHGEVGTRAQAFLSSAKRPARADLFEAVQAGAVECLSEVPGPHQSRAVAVLRDWFVKRGGANEPPDVGEWLSQRTFFTELRRVPPLRERIWPVIEGCEYERAFRESMARATLLSAAARLGHSFIDLYVVAVGLLGSLDHNPRTTDDEAVDGSEVALIRKLIEALERQRVALPGERGWGAFDELSSIASHFELICHVNVPEVGAKSLRELPTLFGTLLGRQQPVGGMSGQIGKSVVRQFRMPGYPFVLVSTDLLQEGEDLHTFCSAVHHYGLAWTPSAIEQRIGRVDRVRSATDRRLGALDRPLEGADKLQVFFPHLEDTVEVLQVERVLERVNTFLRLMHDGLTAEASESPVINASVEFLRERRGVPQIQGKLVTAFPIREEDVAGTPGPLGFSEDDSAKLKTWFLRLAKEGFADAEWAKGAPEGTLWGTAHLGSRIQPFTLLLRSMDGRLVVRCISPIGELLRTEDAAHDEVLELTRRLGAPIAAVRAGSGEVKYDATVELSVLLGGDDGVNQQRIAQLVARTVRQADRMESELKRGQDKRLDSFRPQIGEEAQRER